MDNIYRYSRFALLSGLLLLSGLAAAACSSSESYEVTLRNASGLTDESPVFVAGVQVGQVTGVEIQGNRATVAFEIESKHEIALHSDVCATLQAPTGVIALGLQSGSEGTFEGNVIPECSAMDLMQEALGATLPDIQFDLDGQETGRQAGEFVRDLADGLREGLEESPPTME